MNVSRDYIQPFIQGRAHHCCTSCFLIALCSSPPVCLHGCMTTLKQCADTIVNQRTSSCIYDSIKFPHKDKEVECYGLSALFFGVCVFPAVCSPHPAVSPFLSVISSDLWSHLLRKCRQMCAKTWLGIFLST